MHNKIPVDLCNGEIVLPEIIIHNIKIPESIHTVTDGYIDNITLPSPLQLNPIHVDKLDNYEVSNGPTNFDTSVIRTQHLNSEEKEKILKLCKKYKDIFYDEKSDLTFTSAIKHEIRTRDEHPIYVRGFRHPKGMIDEITNQVNKLLDNKIIRPSISPYSAPVWIVPKKADASGKKKFRMVVDYRKLNENTIDDKYVPPRIDEILDNLGKATYFTTLDLVQGFHQIKVHPNSIEKTAFSVPHGHFEFVRMPFGLKNAPATFEKLMDNILRPFLYKFCFVYMDDVIIFSKSLHEHLVHVATIFETFRKTNLKVQLDKSEFLTKEVAFLGHV